MLGRLLQTVTLLILGSLFNLALAATYSLPKTGNDIVGEVFTVGAKPGDTLGSLGLRYGMSYHEMTEANPRINPQAHLRGGQRVVIPAQFILPSYRKGIVINMAELRLYYFPPGENVVMTYPVAMGRDQWRTPTATTSVVSKEVEPIWHVPESIRQWTFENSGKLLPEKVPPGPDNPLGHYALHLGINGYLIHGNNSSQSIGKYVSSGCIRMNNNDIETLFNMVKVGTPVHIVHSPDKIGWHNGVLYQESQIPVQLNSEFNAFDQSSLSNLIEQRIAKRPAIIDWQAVETVAQQHRGIPEPIGYSTRRHANMESDEPPRPLSANEESEDVSASEFTDEVINLSELEEPGEDSFNLGQFSQLDEDNALEGEVNP